MYKIVDIFWERVNLHLVFDKKIKNTVFLVSKKEQNELIPYNNEVILNITNTPEGTMLSAGEWYLTINDQKVLLDSKLLKKLNDFSRNFLYRNKKYAYIINLIVNENLNLIISTKFMVENTHPKKYYNLCETSKITDKIKIIFKRIVVWISNVYYKMVRLFKRGKKNILFLTENSNNLTWNLKYLYEYLPQNKYKIRIYAINKYNNQKHLFNQIKEITAIALSDIIFIDNYTSIISFINLSKKVKLVQLWHAGIGFKSVGYARFGLDNSPHPYVSSHRKYTDAIVDQDNLIAIYQEVFGVPKSIFKSYGMPRLDNYLDENKIKLTVAQLSKLNDKINTSKVILFSPTYRGASSNTAKYDFSLIDLDKMFNFCKKNNFIFIIKMHPFIKERINILDKYQKVIFDYSNIDLNDLIYISDIMITDYSSCAYEYSLFNRPIIFYRFDKELYEYQRPIHTVDYFTKKQYEVRTFDEVMETLEKIRDINIKDRFKYIEKIPRKNACEKIVQEIIGD